MHYMVTFQRKIVLYQYNNCLYLVMQWAGRIRPMQHSDNVIGVCPARKSSTYMYIYVKSFTYVPMYVIFDHHENILQYSIRAILQCCVPILIQWAERIRPMQHSDNVIGVCPARKSSTYIHIYVKSFT